MKTFSCQYGTVHYPHEVDRERLTAGARRAQLINNREVMRNDAHKEKGDSPASKVA